MDNNKIKRFFINIFSLTSCLSVAINNVGLVIAGILSFNDRNNIKYIYDEYRDIINAFCVFWVCLLPFFLEI